MTSLHIPVSDDLKTRLEARAAELGFDRVEAYVESLLQADAQSDTTADEELEQLLLHRLNDPNTVEVTPAFIHQFKQEIEQRRQPRGNQR